jgi:hypothetical protein
VQKKPSGPATVSTVFWLFRIETVETVFNPRPWGNTGLKPGVNEKTLRQSSTEKPEFQFSIKPRLVRT